MFLFRPGHGRPYRIERSLRRIVYRGDRRFCPCCGCGVRVFLPHGRKPRPNARCPVCGALERHRMVSLLFERMPELIDGSLPRVLHFAPERPIEWIYRHRPGLDYLTADLGKKKPMHRIDIREIPFPDDSFDVVICSHVLEHVDDDRRALAEIGRVLSPRGRAILMVPIEAPRTVEADGPLRDLDRRRAFGHPDHVRRYGPDFRERITAAGLVFDEYRAPGLAPPGDIERLGLKTKQVLFLCRKA